MSTTSHRIAPCLVFAILATAAFAAPKVGPPPKLPSGCEPAEVRKRLTELDSADVAKVCGGVLDPWMDRGVSGRGLPMRVYGRRHASAEWASRVANLLVRDADVDTAYGMRPIEINCDSAAHVPVYVIRMVRKTQSTVVVLRFDLAAALVFDSGHPLGRIEFEDRADSLWAALGEVLGDDPLLREPRPAAHELSGEPPTIEMADAVEEMPEALEQIPPVYPNYARANDISGVVWVQALVGKDGQVRDAYVLSGPTALRDPALDSIWQWRFKPATHAHQPVAVWVRLPVKFTLR